MKKFILSAIAALVMVTTAGAQTQTPEEFVSDFSKFVGFVSSNRHLKPGTLERADSIYGVYTQEFDNDYKSLMTEEQKEEFYKAKGRYEHFQLKVRAHDAEAKGAKKLKHAENDGKKMAKEAKVGMDSTVNNGKNFGEKMLDKSKMAIKKGKKKGAELVDQSGELIQQGKEKGAQLIDNGKEKGAQLVDDGKDKGSELVEQGKDKGAKLGKKMKQKGRKVINQADTVGDQTMARMHEAGHKVGKFTHRVFEGVDSVGHRVGRGIENGYDESASWLRGLFDKK